MCSINSFSFAADEAQCCVQMDNSNVSLLCVLDVQRLNCEMHAELVSVVTLYLGLLVVTEELHLIVIDVGPVDPELFAVEPLSATQGLQLIPGHLTGHSAI